MEGADELTIDELAARVGMTVRNIRAHQSRGLVPPPRLVGRTGFYGAEHVRRLETIRMGAESEAKRIMADGRRRADSLLAGVRPSYEQGLGDVG